MPNTAELSPAQELIKVLNRAHRMSCSDPDNPAHPTLYSRARDEIQARLDLEEQLEAVNERLHRLESAIVSRIKACPDQTPGCNCNQTDFLKELIA